MTRDEALKAWTHCRQLSRWKDNYSPIENDGELSRKLQPKAYADAVLTQVAKLDMWPSAQYMAVVSVDIPGKTIGQGAAAVTVAAKHLFYLAVRKVG